MLKGGVVAGYLDAYRPVEIAGTNQGGVRINVRLSACDLEVYQR
jgi:hypothetical protein